MSSKEIARTTNLSERTVRYALKILRDQGLVREIFLLEDARRRVYTLNLGFEKFDEPIKVGSF
ncbi:hypothetical protein PNA2_0457 [Pyrococcus sp. NA2]|uniref:helix-turn-helix domain-containing protein n=1 Tax=Pyrococcus sp. (strain NA2) TaxID=342949 RepID=UPI000209AA54|nr:helix-turn-helix domain-containing protein [Pyrococcus sp. NA2]AEC51373.1 hypothetical protein PNA2_0457 [Pyrococcus sp. NA2]